MPEPTSRLAPDGLPEFRHAVAERMAASGWPMVHDDQGSVLLELDGLLDAIIVATATEISARIDDALEGHDG